MTREGPPLAGTESASGFDYYSWKGIDMNESTDDLVAAAGAETIREQSPANEVEGMDP